jgi:hypothetical protein
MCGLLGNISEVEGHHISSQNFAKERFMRLRASSVAILFATALSVAVGAQSGGTMAEDHKMDAKEVTYTGCLEAGSALGTFALTHLTTPAHLRLSMTGKGDMKRNAPAPATLSLTSSSIDLSTQLGHEVSVSGTVAHDMMNPTKADAMAGATPSFTVKSLKVVAAICSHS